MTQTLIDVLGWIGSVMLIVAYLQNSRNKLDAQSTTYQLLNAVGSALLVINSMFYGAYPSGALNVIWVLIGIHYFIRNTKLPKEVD